MINHYKRLLLVLTLASGMLLLSGCPTAWDDDDYYESYDQPVYLSYNELRSSVALLPARELQSIGRIYLYENLFFLNERNQGIHIFDNSNPAKPHNSGFLHIPGNTELAIRDSYLYADSYVDLVTLDLNDVTNIREIDREESVFPWDAYQNVPDGVQFDFSNLDENLGVVIGYE